MRTTAALLFFVLACWRGYLDWQNTMAIGETFSMASVATVWASIHPAGYEAYLPQLQAIDYPYWQPSLELFLASPALLLLGGLTVFFYAIRRRRMPPELAYGR